MVAYKSPNKGCVGLERPGSFKLYYVERLQSHLKMVQQLDQATFFLSGTNFILD